PGRARRGARAAGVGHPGPAEPGGGLPSASPRRRHARHRPVRHGPARSGPEGAVGMTVLSTTLSATALQARLARTGAGKGLRLLWRRRPMTIPGVVLAGVNYLGFSLFIGGGHLVKDLMVLTLPAMLAATIANVVSIGGSGGIAEEINGGTLEQA